VKINFHRVLLGFFENWDKSPQKKWDKGEENGLLQDVDKFGIICANNFPTGRKKR
jgi:phosphoribosyl-AMP cyclohydrolase